MCLALPKITFISNFLNSVQLPCWELICLVKWRAPYHLAIYLADSGHILELLWHMMVTIPWMGTIWEKLGNNHSILKRTLANSSFAGKTIFDRSAKRSCLQQRSQTLSRNELGFQAAVHHLWVPCKGTYLY